MRTANRLLTLEHISKASKEATVIKEATKNWNKAHLESIEKFKTGQKLLKTHKGINLSENEVRKILHQAGFPTFPRPKGIPKEYIVTFSDKGCGMKYIHPENPHISIRVMPGKPHSPNLHQQKPYVIHIKDDLAFDKFGNKISPKYSEAHILLDKFMYRSE